jgi:hypothetical protein
MVRIREILDPDLRQRILTALAEQRGCSVAGIPDWYELDDADYVDLIQQITARPQEEEELKDPRM